MRVLETAGSKAASGAYAASLAAIAGSTTPRLPAELTAVYVRMEDDRKYQRTVGELHLRMTVGAIRESSAFQRSQQVCKPGACLDYLASSKMSTAAYSFNLVAPAVGLA